MKKFLLSLGLIGMIAAAPAAYAGHNGHHNHNHGQYNKHGHNNYGHYNRGHHNHNNGFRGFPLPIPIPVPIPVPNPYPNPYCTPGWDCYERAPIRVWVTEYEYRQYPYPHQARYQRLVTARWDKRFGGYWYYNNHGQYVRVR